MAAARKPTAMLQASGAFKAHPERARSDPDTGRGIGPAPASLPEDIRAEWDTIVSETAAGVWQSSDRGFLVALATLLADLKADPRGFGVPRLTVLKQMLAQAGMTPADRSRVSVAAQPNHGKAKTGLAAFR